MAEKTIAQRGLAWQKMAPEWELIEDLMGGTSSMRQAGLRWLPREQAESWEAWRRRLQRTVLFNGFARTVQALAGRPFVEPVQLAGGAAEQQALAANIDGNGMQLAEFARHLLLALLTDGMTHIQLDRPKEGGPVYFIQRQARQLIGQRLDERGALTQVRLSESRLQEKGNYGEEMIEIIRCFSAERWEVWQPQPGWRGGWRMTGSGPHNLGRVPLVSLNANPSGPLTARPPLSDLAWLNLAHWQSSSDQRHILHVARVPLLFGRNLQIGSGELEIGPNRLILTDDPAAELKFVEHSGAAIEAGRQDLIDLEDKMAVMGLEMLSRPQAGPVTATARRLDAAQNHAALAGILQALRNGLNQAFTLAALWSGLPADQAGRVEISQQWGLRDEVSAMADWLLQARMAGEIDRETFLSEVSRRGLIDFSHSASAGTDTGQTGKPKQETLR